MENEQRGVVVVGVDGSPESVNAAHWGARYATATGATLRLVTCWSWPMVYGAPMFMEGSNQAEDARTVAEKTRADLAMPVDQIELLVVEGSTGQHLVQASNGAQALVVGSRGHGSVTGVLLGSVSSYCVHHAACPVVVVR